MGRRRRPYDPTKRNGHNGHAHDWRGFYRLAPDANLAPRLVVVRSLRGDQIARMEARHQISEAQFAAGRHYQSLHEIAFARALHTLDLAARVIDKNRYGIEPSDQTV